MMNYSPVYKSIFETRIMDKHVTIFLEYIFNGDYYTSQHERDNKAVSIK